MSNEQKLREAHDYKQANGSMNCMQCVAAYMLGFPVEMVPDFALHADATLAWDAFHAFFKAHGYEALMLPSTHAPESDYLASGSTSRGTKHIVVMNDGELVFDPHPSNAGLSKIDCIYVIARQAIALPTAAPVGERLTLPAEDVHAAFVKHFPKTRISQAWIGFAAEIAEAIAARAALSAGDAVDAQRLDFIEKSARCDPKMDGHHVWWPTSLNKAIKGPTLRAAIDAAMRKEKP